MGWLDQYNKELKNKKRIEKAEIGKKLLDDLKKKHLTEKESELIILKNRIQVLESELNCIRK